MIQSHAEIIIGNSLKLRKNSVAIDSKRKDVKTELAALRQKADKDERMFKSLYESLVSGLIDADEYREMRDSYEKKIQANLACADELEKRQTELDRQIAEYCEISDVIADTTNTGITAKIIDCLIDRIKIYSDRSIDVDFSFNTGFDMIREVEANG